MAYNFKESKAMVICPKCGQMQEITVKFNEDETGTIVGVEIAQGLVCSSCGIELPSNTPVIED